MFKLKTLTAAADWLWDLKNLLKFGFIIEKQEVFFVGGYGETFLRKVPPKVLTPPSPLPKIVISISCVECISFLTLYPFFHVFNLKTFAILFYILKIWDNFNTLTTFETYLKIFRYVKFNLKKKSFSINLTSILIFKIKKIWKTNERHWRYGQKYFYQKNPKTEVKNNVESLGRPVAAGYLQL